MAATSLTFGGRPQFLDIAENWAATAAPNPFGALDPAHQKPSDEAAAGRPANDEYVERPMSAYMGALVRPRARKAPGCVPRALRQTVADCHPDLESDNRFRGQQKYSDRRRNLELLTLPVGGWLSNHILTAAMAFAARAASIPRKLRNDRRLAALPLPNQLSRRLNMSEPIATQTLQYPRSDREPSRPGSSKADAFLARADRRGSMSRSAAPAAVVENASLDTMDKIAALLSAVMTIGPLFAAFVGRMHP